MISSHEQEDDFHFFYSGLKSLADKLGENFEPNFLMQDACLACYNAVMQLIELDAFPKQKKLLFTISFYYF